MLERAAEVDKIVRGTRQRQRVAEAAALTVLGPYGGVNGPVMVVAGQQMMWSGNTGRSSGSHVHLEIRIADGQRRCPQGLLNDLFDQRDRSITDVASVSGCSF